MTDEREKKQGAGRGQTEMASTSWAQVARDALASTNDLTAISPETLAKLLAFEARDDGVPLFSLLVTVKAHTVWWSALLDALKAGAITTSGE